MCLVCNALTLLLAVSYIVLGTLDSDVARGLWAPYALATGTLASINLVMEWRSRG